MADLNGSSLLARSSASRFRAAGAFRYFAIVRPADPELPHDLAQRPLLHPLEAMKFADLVRCEHRLILYIWVCPPPRPEGCSFQDADSRTVSGASG
jgi:hypothetical protein